MQIESFCCRPSLTIVPIIKFTFNLTVIRQLEPDLRCSVKQRNYLLISRTKPSGQQN